MPTSQRELYEQFYGFAYAVCLRYSDSSDDAAEILNDGFVKVFKGIQGFEIPEDGSLMTRTFMNWLKKIMIRTGINYYRSSRKSSEIVVSGVDVEPATVENDYEHETSGLSYDDLIKLVYQLSPAYRNAFCLFAIDGHKHEEIAGMLGISVGASKSNLAKARKHLRKMLEKVHASKV